LPLLRFITFILTFCFIFLFLSFTVLLLLFSNFSFYFFWPLERPQAQTISMPVNNTPPVILGETFGQRSEFAKQHAARRLKIDCKATRR